MKESPDMLSADNQSIKATNIKSGGVEMSQISTETGIELSPETVAAYVEGEKKVTQARTALEADKSNTNLQKGLQDAENALGKISIVCGSYKFVNMASYITYLVRAGIIKSDGKGGVVKTSENITDELAQTMLDQCIEREKNDKNRTRALQEELGLPTGGHKGHDHSGHHDHGHDHHTDTFHINNARLEKRLKLLREKGFSRHGENGLGNLWIKGKGAIDYVRSWIPLPVLGLSTARRAQYDVHGHDRQTTQINPDAFRSATAQVNLEGNGPHSRIMNNMLGMRHPAQKWDSLKKRWNAGNEVTVAVGSLRIKCKGDRYTMSGYVGHYPDAKLKTITVRHYDDLYMAGLANGIIAPDEHFGVGRNTTEEVTALTNNINYALWNARLQELITHRRTLDTHRSPYDKLATSDMYSIAARVKKCFDEYHLTEDERTLRETNFEKFVEEVLENSGAYRAIDEISHGMQNAGPQKAWIRHFLAESIGEEDAIALDKQKHTTETPPKPLLGDEYLNSRSGDKRWNYRHFVEEITNPYTHLNTKEQDMLIGMIGALSGFDRVKEVTEGISLYIGGPEKPKYTLRIYKDGISFFSGKDHRTIWESRDTIKTWSEVPEAFTHMLHSIHFDNPTGIGFFAGQLTEIGPKIIPADPKKYQKFGNITYDEDGLMQSLRIMGEACIAHGVHKQVLKTGIAKREPFNGYVGWEPQITIPTLKAIAGICRKNLGETRPFEDRLTHITEEIYTLLIDTRNLSTSECDSIKGNIGATVKEYISRPTI